MHNVNKSNDAVITVTLNPAVDMFFEVDVLRPGTLHRVKGMSEQPGGKGINVSKALLAFDVPTISTGFLGGSHGQWLRQQLRQLPIDERFVDIEADTRVNVKIIDQNGQLTELNSSQQGQPTETQRRMLQEELFRAAGPNQWICFCGSIPAYMDSSWYKDMITGCKERGAHVLLDTSDEPLRQGIAAHPDVIKPNKEELSQLVSRDLSSLEEVIQAAQEVAEIGVPLVVVTLGSEGLVAATKETVYRVTVPHVDVVSSVGAGDTVVAGILYGFLHQLSLPNTLQFAAAAGTAAVSQIGVVQPTFAHVTGILPQIHVEQKARGRSSR